MLGFPICLAASYGLTVNAETILLGVHKTDVEDHPEYRVEALNAFENAIQIATRRPLKIIAPFIEQSKSEL
jgi:7-cyano-7-deazaguanine synthase in queuosine biosynthesis